MSLYVYCRRNIYHTTTLVTNDVSKMSVEREAGAVAALNLKLPSWPSDPDLWFAQVEVQFSTRGITSQKTKYEYIVAEFARICDPGVQTRHRTTRSNANSSPAPPSLNNGTSNGYSTPPSWEIRDPRNFMQQLLGGGTADADAKLLRELFLQRLPSNVCMVLASFGDTKPLKELAELGENIIAAGVSGVTQPEPSHEVEELHSELAQLRERVSTLSTSTRTRSPSPRRRLFRPRSPPPHPTPSLMVDMSKYHLVDSVTNLMVQGIQATLNSPSPSLLSKEPSTLFDAVLLDFPTVSLPSTGTLPIKHSVTHHIPTNGPPVSAKARRPSPQRLKIAHQATCSSSTVVKQLVLSLTHGTQDRRLAPMWGLSCA